MLLPRGWLRGAAPLFVAVALMPGVTALAATPAHTSPRASCEYVGFTIAGSTGFEIGFRELRFENRLTVPNRISIQHHVFTLAGLAEKTVHLRIHRPTWLVITATHSGTAITGCGTLGSGPARLVGPF